MNDLLINISALLREHEENRIEGETIDDRSGERAGMAGRIIAAVRRHDEEAKARQSVLLEPRATIRRQPPSV